MNTTNVGRVLFQLLEADVDNHVFNVCGRTSIEFSRVMELVPTDSSQQESLESAVQVYEVATDKLEKICSVPDSWDEIKTFVSEALGE